MKVKTLRDCLYFSVSLSLYLSLYNRLRSLYLNVSSALSKTKL